MVIPERSRVDLLTRQRAVFGLVIAILVSSGCQRDCGWGSGEKGKKIETAALGQVRVGRELAEFYVAYGYDSAVLGFSVSTGAGPARYFPIFASTSRGIPSVVLEVYASKSEEEMWVRSSWPGNEILAYHRVGAETAMTLWGETTFIETPMPDHLSGGAKPFPELIMGNTVKKATFKHQ
jgi:hypothetical protein